MASLISLSVDRLRVVVRIDGRDISRADGNDGVDPWHVLVPYNRFVATGELTTALIACCPSCGPDCAAVEARIRREGGVVRWEWGRRGARWDSDRSMAVFDAGAYDAEVARLGADRNWETPMRRAGRLILTDLDLPAGIEGVRVCAGDAGQLEVWLEEPGEYQIFVRVPWDAQRLADSVAGARDVLAGPAEQWSAEWHSVVGGQRPPVYAGPSWRQADWA